MAQTAAAKTCVTCGLDCSGKPRVKDAQGRYMCRACLDRAGVKKSSEQKGADADARDASVKAAVARATAKSPQAAARATAAGFDTADDAGADLAGLAVASETAPCISCGLPIAPAVVVCPSCGFNKRTRKAPKKVNVSAEGSGVAAVAGAAANVLVFANPLVWAAAACIAGVIGAAAWYFMVTRTGHEVRLVTLGIGMMVGLTVKLASGKYSGVVSGAIAAGVTLVAIFVGYWFTYQHLVGQFEKDTGMQHAFDITDEQALVEYARVRVQALESAQQPVNWPEGLNSDSASERGDFPPVLWKEAEAAWKKATPGWRDRFKADARLRLLGGYEDAEVDGFVSFVFLDDNGVPEIKGLLMVGGSLLAALFVGSGGALSGAGAAARME